MPKIVFWQNSVLTAYCSRIHSNALWIPHCGVTLFNQVIKYWIFTALVCSLYKKFSLKQVQFYIDADVSRMAFLDRRNGLKSCYEGQVETIEYWPYHCDGAESWEWAPIADELALKFGLTVCLPFYHFLIFRIKRNDLKSNPLNDSGS